VTRLGLTEHVHAKDRLWDALGLRWQTANTTPGSDGWRIEQAVKLINTPRSRGLRWPAATLASTGNPYQGMSSTAIKARRMDMLSSGRSLWLHCLCRWRQSRTGSSARNSVSTITVDVGVVKVVWSEAKEGWGAKHKRITHVASVVWLKVLSCNAL
jgi:hypothetical protein